MMDRQVMESFRLAFLGRMRAQGYKTVGRIETDGNWTAVEKAGLELFRLNPQGDLFYHRNEMVDQEQQDAVQLFKKMKNQYLLFEQAKPFEVLNDEGFRLISEMGNVVLAATMKENQELSFVTWEYDYDRSGVHWGNYYDTHFDSAKMDFAIRARLIKEEERFDQNELLAIYKAGMLYQAMAPGLKSEEEKTLLGVIEKIEEIIPEALVNLKQELELEMDQEPGLTGDEVCNFVTKYGTDDYSMWNVMLLNGVVHTIKEIDNYIQGDMDALFEQIPKWEDAKASFYLFAKMGNGYVAVEAVLDDSFLEEYSHYGVSIRGPRTRLWKRLWKHWKDRRNWKQTSWSVEGYQEDEYGIWQHQCFDKIRGECL